MPSRAVAVSLALATSDLVVGSIPVLKPREGAAFLEGIGFTRDIGLTAEDLLRGR